MRPSESDLKFVASCARAKAGTTSSPLSTLLLGVTPEIASLDWPVPVSLLAVDHSPAMIAHVWPGDTPQRRAVCADWRDLPVASASIDLVVGDGCFSVFDYPRGYRELAVSLARVLRPGGLFVIRLYCRPHVKEAVEAVFEDVWAGRMGNVHVFKWRLAMALQGDDIRRGVRLQDIWQAYRAHVGDPTALAARLGWPLPEISTLEAYQAADAAYTYATVEEVLDMVGPEFERVEEWRGTYELGERCPQLVLRRRA